MIFIHGARAREKKKRGEGKIREGGWGDGLISKPKISTTEFGIAATHTL